MNQEKKMKKIDKIISIMSRLYSGYDERIEEIVP